jgi:hypothetical protein
MRLREKKGSLEEQKYCVRNRSPCDNPFKFRGHSRTIVCYVVLNGVIYATCSECWRKVNDHRSEKTWTNDQVSTS